MNFLGLGGQRTLVLVNGRRFISSNTASIFGPASPGEQVDLAQINTKLIDRIETIAIGGAPIYGSDAIAGTINIILKHDYQGFDLDGEDGISDQADAHNWRIRALVGHNFLGGRANLTARSNTIRARASCITIARGWRTGSSTTTARRDRCYPVPLQGRAGECDRARRRAAGRFSLRLGFRLQPVARQSADRRTIHNRRPGPTGKDVLFDAGGQLVPFNYGLNPGGDDIFSLFAMAATASRTFAIRPRHCRIQSGTIPTCSAILTLPTICGSSPRVGIHTARARTSQHSRNITAVSLTVRARLPAALSSVSTTRS